MKKTKKKRKRKSLAAKLARYNGELCDLPVTYVEPDEGKSLSVLYKPPDQTCYYVGEKTPSADFCHVVMDSLSHQGDKKKTKSTEDETETSTLVEELKMVIKNRHINESCSSESNSENEWSARRSQMFECSASS